MISNKSARTWVVVVASILLILSGGVVRGENNAPSPFSSPVYFYLPLVSNGANARRGVAMGWPECGDYDLLRPSLAHNWGMDICGLPRKDPHFVDMLWDDSPIGRPVDSLYLLGFNEFDVPSSGGGSDMSMERVVSGWHSIESLYPEHILVSPSAGSHRYSVFSFIDAYGSTYGHLPRLDAIQVHFYYSPIGQSLRDYLTAIHDRSMSLGYNGDIWLTEMGSCWPGAEEWMGESVAWLDRTEWVKAYFWFTDRMGPIWQCGSNLVDSEGQITNLGLTYINLP